MDAFETQTHSFIIRVWLEETGEEMERATWRGHITHVPSDRRRYVKELHDITAFILPYLGQMGIRLGFVARMRLWWKEYRKRRA